jgi:hypothetical protein
MVNYAPIGPESDGQHASIPVKNAAGFRDNSLLKDVKAHEKCRFDLIHCIIWLASLPKEYPSRRIQRAEGSGNEELS